MKTNTNLPSSRRYAIAFIEGDAACTYFPTLSDILDSSDDMEYKYAIQEEFDKLLDLKVGDRLLMNFNRDNTDSAGYIKRTA
jgi:hypothetical protein